MPSFSALAVEIDVRSETLRSAPDDGEHEPEAIVRRTDHRLRRTANPNPGLQSPRVSLAPDGSDVFIDNVGGTQLEAGIGRMRQHGRVAMVGAVSQYNLTESPMGPNNLYEAATKGVTRHRVDQLTCACINTAVWPESGHFIPW